MSIEHLLGSKDLVLSNLKDSIKNTCIGNLYEIREAIKNHDIKLALSLNSGLKTTCLIEDNAKAVNDIYLNSIAIGKAISKGQLSDLESIAEQCPITGGRAVYSARAMRNAATGEIFEYEDNCGSKLKRSFNKTQNQSTCKIYPNPNNGKMQLEYSLETCQNGKVLIFDISGRLVYSRELNSGKHQIALDLNLEKGVYLCKIEANGEILRTERLVILK